MSERYPSLSREQFSINVEALSGPEEGLAAHIYESAINNAELRDIGDGLYETDDETLGIISLEGTDLIGNDTPAAYLSTDEGIVLIRKLERDPNIYLVNNEGSYSAKDISERYIRNHNAVLVPFYAQEFGKRADTAYLTNLLVPVNEKRYAVLADINGLFEQAGLSDYLEQDVIDEDLLFSIYPELEHRLQDGLSSGTHIAKLGEWGWLIGDQNPIPRKVKKMLPGTQWHELDMLRKEFLRGRKFQYSLNNVDAVMLDVMSDVWHYATNDEYRERAHKKYAIKRYMRENPREPSEREVWAKNLRQVGIKIGVFTLGALFNAAIADDSPDVGGGYESSFDVPDDIDIDVSDFDGIPTNFGFEPGHEAVAGELDTAYGEVRFGGSGYRYNTDLMSPDGNPVDADTTGRYFDTYTGKEVGLYDTYTA